MNSSSPSLLSLSALASSSLHTLLSKLLSQKARLIELIANHSRVNTYAYLRRTDYVETFGNKSDRASWRHFYASFPSADWVKSKIDSGPFSKEKADALQQSRKNQSRAGTSFPFDPDGALNDVVAAPTPLGVSAALKLYKPWTKTR
jgi:hypothetical protein